MKAQNFKGKPVDDKASKACVLFDPKTGRVVHVHGVTVLDGARAVGEAELERRARTHAAALGRAVSDLEALHVPLSAVRQRGALRVDGGKVVVAQPPADAKRSDLRNR